jgi:predicted nucleotidyltransferase
MGTNDPKLGTPDSPLAGALFSKIQQRVLGLIFGHPERSFYLREMVNALKSGIGAVDRELSRLEKSGLVTVERIGNQKHYRANPASPIFAELHALILKTVGLSEPLRQALQPVADRTTAAFVYGSIAKGTDTAKSDIDLMVIGRDLTYADLYDSLEAAEQVLARTINPTILERTEWNRKRSEHNAFIENVCSQPKIFIIGTEASLNDESEPR